MSKHLLFYILLNMFAVEIQLNLFQYQNIKLTIHLELSYKEYALYILI
jgi:hypothetical protein